LPNKATNPTKSMAKWTFIVQRKLKDHTKWLSESPQESCLENNTSKTKP
jgi:hypothetical protein